MFSDFARTQELITSANNSAGASTEQFGKTMDSLDVKLTNLKNAWDSFTMGLMDSNLIKGMVDILQGLLTLLNDFTNFFGKASGFAKIGVVAGALTVADRALNTFTKSMKEDKTVLQALWATLAKGPADIKKAFDWFTKKPQKIKLNSTELDQAKEKADALKKSLKKATDYQEAGGKANPERLKKLEAAANNAEEEADTQRTSFDKLSGLSGKKMETFNKLLEEGRGSAEAFSLAQSGLSTSTIEWLDSLNKGTDGLNSFNMAEKLNDRTGLQRLASLKGLTFAEKLQNVAVASGTETKIGSAAASMSAALANAILEGSIKGVLKALLPLGLILLAVAAAIALVTVCIKSAIRNSPEGKLKAAQEGAKAAAEAANEAAEAYNNLNDSFESLSDGYDTLEDMTRGTKEWREQVSKLNQQVLELVKTYPELGGFVESENGVLTLDLNSEDVQDVLLKYLNQSDAAQAASIGADIQERESAANAVVEKIVTNPVQYKYFNSNRREWETKSASVKIDSTVLQDLAEAVANGEIKDVYDSTQWKSWLSSHSEILGNIKESNGSIGAKAIDSSLRGQVSAALANNAEKILQIADIEKTRTSYFSGLSANAVSRVDSNGFTNNELSMIDNAATKDYAESFYESTLKQIKDDPKNKTTLQAYAEAMGDDYFVDTKGKLKRKYMENDTEKTETINTKDETVQAQMAAVLSSSKMTESLEKIPQAVSSLEKNLGDKGKGLGKAYATEGYLGMTQAQANQFNDADLDKAWNNKSEEDKAAWGGNLETFKAQMAEIEEANRLAWDQTVEYAGRAGLTNSDKSLKLGLGELTAQQARGFSELMSTFVTLNRGNYNELLDATTAKMNSMTEDQKTGFVSALNSVQDWADEGQIDALKDTFIELGLATEDDVDKFDDLIDNLKKASGAIRSFKTDELEKIVRTVGQLVEKIKSGAQGREFSEEDYLNVINNHGAAKKDFVKNTGGNYVYIGNNVEDVVKNLEEYSTTATQGSVNRILSQIEMGKLFKDYLNASLSKEDFLRVVQIRMSDMGHEILGFEDFGTTSNISALSEKRVNEIYDTILGYSNNLSNLYAERADQQKIISMTYMGNLAAQNIVGVWNAIDGKKVSDTTEFDSRIKALLSQAQSAGIAEPTIQSFQKIAEAFKNGKGDIKEFEESLANIAELIDFSGATTQLKGVAEAAETASDNYEKLAADDDLGRKTTASAAAEKFGIEIEDKDAANQFMDLLNQALAGNETSWESILVQALEAAGVNNDENSSLNSLLEGGIDEAVGETMQNLGLGVFRNGQFQFFSAAQFAAASGSDASGNADDWKSAYTWIYNQTARINKLTRERERIERQYTLALEEEKKTAKEIYELSKAELANLKNQAKEQNQNRANAQARIKQLQEEYADFANYVELLKDSDGNIVGITRNLSELRKASFSEDDRDRYEQYLSYLEEETDAFNDAVDALDDIEDEIKTISKRGREETSTLYNQIQNGIIKEIQNEIDALQDVNDAIQDAQTALVDQIQTQIDDARQARDNAKTEQDIQDKQTRLSYLMRDTSGANASEIASLQKEIAEAQESYSDTLIDQAIQNLQDANEEAAQQRERQIELLTSQLDAYQNSRKIWADVQEILQESLGGGQPFSDTVAAAYIKLAEDYDTKNVLEQQDIASEMNQNAKLASVFTTTGLDAAATSLAEEANKILSTITNVPEAADVLSAAIGGTDEKGGLAGDLNALGSAVGATADAIISSGTLINDWVGVEKAEVISPKSETQRQETQRQEHGGGYFIPGTNTPTYKYASGGLADFTGPAWLDGSISKPEIVLNSRDTENFLALRDILSELMTAKTIGGHSSNTAQGDNYYDIDISVDSIGENYDVDQMAERIKSIIYEDAIYRNVNTINNIR